MNCGKKFKGDFSGDLWKTGLDFAKGKPNLLAFSLVIPCQASSFI